MLIIKNRNDIDISRDSLILATMQGLQRR